jgi:hypothetical protein
LALTVAMVATLGSAGSAAATMVTVGPPLPVRINESVFINCGGPCVVFNPTAPTGYPDRSPVTGVILRWSLDWGTRDAGYRLRVISSTESGYLGSGTSARAVPIRYETVETFATRLPIQAGQLIGLEAETEASEIWFEPSPTVTSVFLTPSVADGQTTQAASGWSNGYVFPFDAEVLPVPYIADLSATSGPAAGEDQITIDGENFAEIESVDFGATAAKYTVDSMSELKVTVPPGQPKTSVPVTVTTAAGKAEAPIAYGYEAAPASPTPLATCVVPHLKGRSLAAARRVLARRGCRVGKIARRGPVTARTGRVKRQSPPSMTVLPAGGKVQMTVAAGPADDHRRHG